jgi:hypothetical protein
MYVSAIPILGRDYTSKAAVLADWQANKDFLVVDLRHSGYINREQAVKEGITLNIRYAKQRKVCVCN